MDSGTAASLVVAAVGSGMLGAYLHSNFSRKPSREPDPPRTHDELKSFVQAVIKEVDTAIALTSLARSFSEDARIGPTYDNTFEAHGFERCRSSIESCLILCIMRCHDHRRDSHGLVAFFDSLNDGATKVALRDGILQRRRAWVSEEEAQRETNRHMAEIEVTREQHNDLKGSHQFARVRNYRHTKIAHGALEVVPMRAQPVFREHIYHLTDQTKEIVQSLSSAVLGESQGFNRWVEIWDDTYTSAFFDTLMERADD